MRQGELCLPSARTEEPATLPSALPSAVGGDRVAERGRKQVLVAEGGMGTWKLG